MKKLLIATVLGFVMAVSFWNFALAESESDCIGLGLNPALAEVLCGATSLSGDIIPDTDDTYDIGSATYEFADGHFDGTLTVDTLQVDVATNITGNAVITAGSLDIATSGGTIILEDGTAATSCIGTGHLTGSTAVQITTSCIETGDYVFVTRNTADAQGDEGHFYVDNIVDSTYFEVTSAANDTSYFNWIIIKGQ